MKNTKLFLTVVLFAAACGDDNTAKVDAPIVHDTPMIDAAVAPLPPTLGAQVDRLGRPAINTALNHTFDPSATSKNAAKDAYNQNAAPATWQAMAVPEFMKNLAVLDALDSTPGGTAGDGCGNQISFNGTLGGGGTPTALSYQLLATLLADDQLYVDTAKSACNLYLAVEIEAAGGPTHISCGGRAPSYDVIDFSYTALAKGAGGFVQPGFVPNTDDGVLKHDDAVDATFPFLGTPH